MDENTQSSLCIPGTKLFELCKSRANEKNQIILTFANHGYFDLLLNWLYYIKSLQLTNYVIVALDSQTHKELNELGVDNFLYDHAVMSKCYDAKQCSFNRYNEFFHSFVPGNFSHLSEPFVIRKIIYHSTKLLSLYIIGYSNIFLFVFYYCSVEFMSICNEKPYLVNEILKGGFDCLWTDNDIIFFQVYCDR